MMWSKEKYEEEIQKQINKVQKIAEKARSKGKDPSTEVEIAWTQNFADRTEELVGPENVSKDIKKLADEGYDRDDIAFKIVENICDKKYSKDKEKIDLVDQSIRTGLSIMTGGVVSAPVEGIQEVREFKNEDDSKFIQLLYAGPIRSAGGTVMALSTVLAWYSGKKLGYSQYTPTEKEVERYKEGFRLYPTRQISGSEQDIEYIVRNCPIMINSGAGNYRKKVSINTDIDKIDDVAYNMMRGTTMLVLLEGVLGRAQKIVRRAEDQNVEEDWEWLEKFMKGKEEEEKEKEEEKNVSKNLSDYHNKSYTKNSTIGRAVLSYHQEKGGFALRYGNARNTSLYAFGVHPQVTKGFNNYLTVGTQLKVSYPEKGCTIQVCDKAHPQVVKLENGDVIKMDSEEKRKKYKDKIEEIIFNGEMIVPFGDVEEAGVPLLPSTWTVKWWKKEIKNKNIEINCDKKDLSPETAYNLAKDTNTPLHPNYTYQFEWVESIKDIKKLKKDLKENEKPYLSKNVKKVLEDLVILHKVEEDKIKLEADDWEMLNLILNKEKIKIEKDKKYKDVLEYVNDLVPFTIKNKWPTIIGVRMGRPTNKPEIKSLSPPIKGLFPISESGGNLRRLDKSVKNSPYKEEITFWKCPECESTSPEIYCHGCNTRREKMEQEEVTEKEIPIENLAKKVYNRLGMNLEKQNENEEKGIGDLIKEREKEEFKNNTKLIKKIAASDKIAEPLEKGVLRSKYDIPIYTTGHALIHQTIQSLTSLKPKDIDTSIEKLRELGYDFEDENDEEKFYIQDLVLGRELKEDLLRMANFVDELLEKFYNMEPYYNAETAEDLVGKLIFTIAPHISVTVPLRLVGFTKGRAMYNHPIATGARRRDEDGDADELGLVLDWLLNFSRSYISEKIGGYQGIPIMAITKINQEEIDDQAYGVDTVKEYPLKLYKKAEQIKETDEVRDSIECIGDYVEEKGEVFDECDYTLDTDTINCGGIVNTYVSLDGMMNKFEIMLDTMTKIKSVKTEESLVQIIRDHVLSDYRGNMKAYSQQDVRCAKCNKKWRRMPLTGKCDQCGSDLIHTVNEGNVKKYLEELNETAKKTKKQNISGIEQDNKEILAEVKTFFRKNQKNLDDF
ncbi:MAG: DNA polymerase II large subunit [archaeon]